MSKVLTFEELIKLTNVEVANDNTMFRAPGITLKDTILQAVITSSGSFFCRYGDEKTDYSMVPLGRSFIIGFVPIKLAKGRYAYILNDRESKNPILVYYGENCTVIGEACIIQSENGRISVFALHDKYQTISFSSTDDSIKSVSIRISKTMPSSKAYLIASSVSCQEFSKPLFTDYDKGVLWTFIQKDRSYSEGISPVYTPILFFSGSNCIDICTLNKPSNEYKDFFANLLEQKANEYGYDPEKIGFIKPENYCMCYERAMIADKRRKVSNKEVTNVLETLNKYLSTDDFKKLLKHKSILFGSLYNRIIMKF